MGCQNIRCRKPPGYLPKYIGVVFLCSNYFLLHKSVNSGILEMKKDNRPQGGLPKCLSRNSAHTLVKVLGRFFYAYITFCCCTKVCIVVYYKWKGTTAHKVGCPIGKDGNSALSLGQSVRAVFLCNSYFLLFNTMNVSNAIMNIPKDIKSWKENSSIDITSIHREWRQRHPATRLSLIIIAQIIK